MATTDFSRRAFCAGGMTMLSSLLLPQIGNSDEFSLLPFGAKTAYAEESGSAETEIIVVSRTELGIVAYDMADPNNCVAIPECTVKLTSRYNGQSLEGKTDQLGRIVFDLTTLAEDPDAEILGFNGRIEVQHEDYRDVIIPLARIQSHASVIAPTRPLDSKPYFRTLAMNEWDVQYNNQTFVTSAASTDDNLIEAELWVPDGMEEPDVVLVGTASGKDYKLGALKRVKRDGNFAVYQTYGKFLQEGSEYCFRAYDSLKVDYLEPGANSAFYTELNIETKESALDVQKIQDTVVMPSAAKSVTNIFKMPNSFIPPFGGGTISLWKPTFPILTDFSPFGFAQIGIGISAVYVKADDGSDFTDPDNWKKQPSSSVDKQYEALKNKWSKSLENCDANNAALNDASKTQTFWQSLCKDFKFYLDAQLYASLTYDWNKKYWNGEVNGLVTGKLDIILSKQFFLGTIPMFFNVNPWASFKIGFSLGAVTESIRDIDFVLKQPTLGGGISFGLNVTIGAGCPNVLNMSFTGGGYLSAFFSAAVNPNGDFVRLLAGFGHSGVLTFQAWLVKYTYPIWNVDEPSYFDSSKWENKTELFESSAKSLSKKQLNSALRSRLGEMGMRDCVPVTTNGLPTFKELKENAVIVTNTELAQSKEFEAVSYENLAAAPVSVTKKNSTLTANSGNDELSDVIVVPKNSNNADDTSFLPEYGYVGTISSYDGKPTLGVDGLGEGERGGVKPSVDHLMFQNTNSNPYLKLLTTTSNGATYLFRIATVDVGAGKMRTRVVYHRLDSTTNTWSQPWVVNFDPLIDGVTRDDLYDYEFDVTQANANNGTNYIYLLITSSTRPNGDDTSFMESLEAHHASLVALTDTYAQVDPLQTVPSMTAGLQSCEDGYTLSNPRITGFSDTFSVAGTNDFCVMGFYTRRKVDEETGISSTGRTLSFFGRLEYDSTYSQKLFTITRSIIATDSAPGFFELTALPVKIEDSSYDWSWGSVAACRRTCFAMCGTEWSSIGRLEANYEDHDSSRFASFNHTELASISAKKHKVSRFYPWGDDGQLLATCTNTSDEGTETAALYLVEFDPAKKQEPTFTQIGPTSGIPSNFVVDGSGHFLFYEQNIDAKTGQEYDDEGNVTGDIVEHKHYIMALAQIDGLFTRPFIFCELDHVVDGIVASTVNSSYVTFMVSTIEDIDNSLASIYDVRVPLLKCLTPAKFFGADPFAYSGEAYKFSIEVRNDGNLVATGATYTLYDSQTMEAVDSKFVAFADVPRTKREGEEATYDTDGFSSGLLANPLVADNGNSVLVPGDSVSFDIEFDIPEDWADTKNVTVAISGIQVITPTGLTAGSFQSFHEATNNCPTSQITVNASSKAEIDGYASGERHEHSAKEFNPATPSKAIAIKKVKGFKAKGKKKCVKLSWKSHKANTSGFEIKYAAKKKKLSSAKTVRIKKAKATSCTVKKLKRKKRYYFKMRAYKISNGKTYRSKWTKVKSAKTK